MMVLAGKFLCWDLQSNGMKDDGFRDVQHVEVKDVEFMNFCWYSLGIPTIPASRWVKLKPSYTWWVCINTKETPSCLQMHW